MRSGYGYAVGTIIGGIAMSLYLLLSGESSLSNVGIAAIVLLIIVALGLMSRTLLGKR